MFILSYEHYYLLFILALIIGCGTLMFLLHIRSKKRRMKLTHLFKDSVLAYFTGNFHVVEKGKCYRSGQLSPKRLARYIQHYGIKTIINLRGIHQNKAWWQNEHKIAQKHNVTLINIALSTHALPNAKNLKDILNAFSYASKPLLIHCQHGTDRTSMISALWVLEKKKAGSAEAKKQFSFLKYGYVFFHSPYMKRFIDLWNHVRKQNSITQALAVYAKQL